MAGEDGRWSTSVKASYEAIITNLISTISNKLLSSFLTKMQIDLSSRFA